MSGCDHAVEYIYPYLDEELSSFKKARIRMHLRHCSNCTD
ncbi:MAG: zf-HC2 domain-containing protein, partial [Acidimicrobiia bacterium]